MFVDRKGRNWFKWAHEEKFLRIENIRKSLNDLDKCEILTREESVPPRRSTLPCSGPKDQQKKTDKFLSFFEVMYVIGNSRKDKSKALKKHILKDIVPCGVDARIEETKGSINKPSKKNIMKYKPLNLQMKNINRKFRGLIKRLMTS